MSQRNNLDFIGTGMSDPIRLTAEGDIAVTQYEERLKESIIRTLGEAVGSRFFNRGFGSRIGRLIFEPNDDVLKDLSSVFIREALTRWEPRIRVLTVDVQRQPSRADFTITYNIHASNRPGTVVWQYQTPEL